MEATAAGVPIVASAIPEHRALLGDSYKFLVDDPDAADQAATMIELALEPGAAEHLAEAQARVMAMTPAAVADAYLSVFEKVLGKS
jgi:glycosyltransferase involved in cell wall biosynthesis